MEDENRIARNREVLNKTESEIATLESQFVRLEELRGEEVRLRGEVNKAQTEETALLADESLSEKDAMKRLGELRIRLDVLNARVASTEGKIKTQTTDLANQGEAVRRAFQFVIGRLFVAREMRVTTTLVELFGGDWIILRDGKRLEMKHLAKNTLLMKQVRDLDSKMSHPIGDPAQEWEAWKRARTWLIEIAVLIRDEPGLALKVPAEQQPIEQPREMATA